MQIVGQTTKWTNPRVSRLFVAVAPYSGLHPLLTPLAGGDKRVCRYQSDRRADNFGVARESRAIRVAALVTYLGETPEIL